MKLKEALSSNRILELLALTWDDLREMDGYERDELRKELKEWMDLLGRKGLPFTYTWIGSTKGKLAAVNGMLNRLTH